MTTTDTPRTDIAFNQRLRVVFDDLQPQIEYTFDGAITAARAVLPAMREAGVGTLLFTTGGGSIHPVPMFGNVNAAAGALRNWVLNLHNELAGSGIYAAHIAISTWLGEGGLRDRPQRRPADPCRTGGLGTLRPVQPLKPPSAPIPMYGARSSQITGPHRPPHFLLLRPDRPTGVVQVAESREKEFQR